MLWRSLVQFQAVPLSDSNLRQVVHIKRVTKQYELVPITTGKVTIGLRLHWHAFNRVQTSVAYSPTTQRPSNRGEHPTYIP